MAASCAEGCGMRHSVSNSYAIISMQCARSVPFGS